MSETRELGIALIGCGTVGTGFAAILESHAELLRLRSGRQLRIRHVVVNDTTKPREHLPADVTPAADIDAVLADPATELAVHLVGGVDVPLDHHQKLLRAGKSIVTANKALIYEHGADLFRLAAEHDCTIAFEAAVAGAIPIIAAITQSLTGNRVRSIEAILNGTSNFILTKMLQENRSYEDVLVEAQERGYAEADPAMDVDGTDAAQKLAILTLLAFGRSVRLTDMVQQGIDVLTLTDMQVASELGYRIKLLARAVRTADGLQLSVQPTLIRRSRLVAQTDGADNIVAVVGDASGPLTFSGQGAGRMPTASAVMADVIDYATGRTKLTFSGILRSLDLTGPDLLPQDQLVQRCYLRLTVDDRPHVLADIADVLGRHGISIASVRQDEPSSGEDSESAGLVIVTHRTSEGAFRAADRELSGLNCVRGAFIRLPIAD